MSRKSKTPFFCTDIENIGHKFERYGRISITMLRDQRSWIQKCTYAAIFLKSDRFVKIE